MNFAPLVLSFEVSMIATLLAGVIGVGLASILVAYRFPGREWVDALIATPMILPPTVLGYYLLVALGRGSLIGRAFERATGSPLVFSRAGLVVAATLAALPFIVKSSRAALQDVDPRLVGAARTLGARPLRVFFRVQLPLATGGVVAGLALGFARSLGDFGVTLMIAGNIPGLTQTGALAIYDAVQTNRDAEAAGMIALMTAFAVFVLYAANKLTRPRDHGW